MRYQNVQWDTKLYTEIDKKLYILRYYIAKKDQRKFKIQNCTLLCILRYKTVLKNTIMCTKINYCIKGYKSVFQHIKLYTDLCTKI